MYVAHPSAPRNHVRERHERQDGEQQTGRHRHHARRRTTLTGDARFVLHY
jgi:hypothetical protein